MSGSNRRKFFTTRRLAIAGFFGVVAIVGGGLIFQPPEIEPSINVPESQENSDTRSQGSRSVTCHADCQVTFGKTGIDEHQDANSADGETKTEQYTSNSIAMADFSQQHRMAHWTFIIAMLTGYGVILLVGTLVETANATDAAVKTANITREIGQTQTRAYLGGVKAWVEEHGQQGVYCYFEIKNFGQSPAEKIEVQMRAQYNVTAQGADSCSEKIPYNDRLAAHPRSLAPGAKGLCAIYIDRSFVDKITANKPKEIRFYFMAEVWWFDVYGAEDEWDADELHTHMTASQRLGSWGNNQPIGEMEIQGSDPSGSYRLRH